MSENCAHCAHDHNKEQPFVSKDIILIIVSLILFILGIAGVANMWEAVFADMGVALLAIFNATRLLNTKK